MTLPLHLQMEIDISAASHKREIAEGFAKLRAALPPEPVNIAAILQRLLAPAEPPYWSMQQLANAQCLGAYVNPFAQQFQAAFQPPAAGLPVGFNPFF